MSNTLSRRRLLQVGAAAGPTLTLGAGAALGAALGADPAATAPVSFAAWVRRSAAGGSLISVAARDGQGWHTIGGRPIEHDGDLRTFSGRTTALAEARRQIETCMASCQAETSVARPPRIWVTI